MKMLELIIYSGAISKVCNWQEESLRSRQHGQAYTHTHRITWPLYHYRWHYTQYTAHGHTHTATQFRTQTCVHIKLRMQTTIIPISSSPFSGVFALRRYVLSVVLLSQSGIIAMKMCGVWVLVSVCGSCSMYGTHFNNFTLSSTLLMSLRKQSGMVGLNCLTLCEFRSDNIPVYFCYCISLSLVFACELHGIFYFIEWLARITARAKFLIRN